jgi:Putative Actinobacterial Holin-X, holin superfamily III
VIGGLLIPMLVHLFHVLTAFPLWTCYGVIGGLFAVVGIVLRVLGRQKLARIRLVPQETAATMRGNVQWVKTRVTAARNSYGFG